MQAIAFISAKGKRTGGTASLYTAIGYARGTYKDKYKMTVSLDTADLLMANLTEYSKGKTYSDLFCALT